MFFALPEFSTKDWRVANATFGMAKFFVGQLKKENPDYIVFIKDAKGKNFRHEIYSEYKATRDRMPDSLRSQIGDIEELIARMHIDIIEIPGYEADDVIGTLAVRLAKESENEIYILSGDKDLYALVNEQVKVYDTQRKKISWPEETFIKFWVPAGCVRDYLAICGDSSDNIPGIAGIGPKKAQVLLNEFWTLEKIYDIVDDIENKRDSISEESQKVLKWKALEKFIEWKESAFLSQRLATLDCDMELADFDLDNYAFDKDEVETPELIEFFKELEFFSLIPADEIIKENWASNWKKVQIIWDEIGLADLQLDIFSNYKEIVLDTETTSLNVREAKLVGISVLLSEDKIYYINLMHNWPQINHEIAQKFVKKLLDSDIRLIAHNFKYDLQILENFLRSVPHKNEKKKNPEIWQLSFEL